jgi:predicted TIM-barrel fold metal-dependent hydrolase
MSELRARPSRRRVLGYAAAALPVQAASTSGAIRCIDCQSHLFVPEVVALMQKRKDPPRIYREGETYYLQVKKWVRAWRPEHADLRVKLASMDDAGIDLTALSPNDPGPELFGKEGPEIARMTNDYIAGCVKRYPSRFIGLAVLPLQDMRAAMLELDRCIGQLGMKGILLYSNLDGRFPDEPEFRPLFGRAEEAGLPVLLHPPFPMTFDETIGYNLTGSLGLMFDTTIALCRIIMAGILEDHPKLKLVCPHIGGTLPYLIGRVDHQTLVMKRVTTKIRRPPSEYLKRVYLDAVAPLPMAIRYAHGFIGPDQLLYSSDHPWVEPKLIAGHIRSLRLPPDQERKVFSENAKRLFEL